MNGRTGKPALKTSYRAGRLISPIHTQGPVLLTPDGKTLISTTGEEVILTDVETGRAIGRVPSDTTDVTSMTLSESGVLAVFTRSLSLRFYTIPPPLDASSLAEASTSTPPSEPPTLSLIRHTPRSHPAPVLISTIDPTSTLLASGSADGLVKVWDLAGGFVTHVYRSHGGPISALCFNLPRFGPAKGSRMELITGCADTKVRVFDLRDVGVGGAGGKPRAILDGHVSVVRGLGVTDEGRWLVSGGRDRVLMVWDLWGGDEHGWQRLAGGEAASKKKGKGKAVEVQLARTITVLESLESVGVLGREEEVAGLDGPVGSRVVCWSAGEKGVVKAWDALKGSQLAVFRGAEGVNVADPSEEPDEDEQRGIVFVSHNPSTSTLVSIHSDQNILFHSLKSATISRQVIGYNDEIIDSIFLTPPPSPLSSSAASSQRDTAIALATNSSLIRVYSTTTQDARLLAGHTDMVLCLDRSKDGEWLVSGSKDRTARVWASVPVEGGDNVWRCIAICEGHAESIGAVAVSRKPLTDEGLLRSGIRSNFLFTASQDRTIKMWDLTAIDLSSAEPTRLKSLLTQKIHEKDINSLDVSPNDRLLATGSQDKTVKVFQVDFTPGRKGGRSAGAVSQLGTCKGHKRGVWSVKFSKTDKVLATGSGDKTVRVWSLDDFSCLKTFEGHSNSVLRVDFLTQGQQLVSSSSDGLVKVWNIKDEECATSLDNHEDKIWALAVSEDEKTIVSGAADSIVTFWNDCTQTDEAEKVNKMESTIMNEQKFSNYVNLKDYKNAILLALEMCQPGRLLSLFSSVRSNRPPASATSTLHANASSAPSDDSSSITGSLAVDLVIKGLPALDLVRLLGHVRDWNARAKTSPVAQTVLHAVLRLRTSEEIVEAFTSMKDLPQALKETPGAGGKGKSGSTVPASIGEILDALVPYTERYFDRAERMVQESFILDFALSEMDGGLFGNGSTAFESLTLAEAAVNELDMVGEVGEDESNEEDEQSEEEDVDME